MRLRRLLALLAVAAGLAACAQTGGKKAELGPAEQARAQELFDNLSAAS
jgi:hypothetical protein